MKIPVDNKKKFGVLLEIRLPITVSLSRKRVTKKAYFN